ncbi:MAG: FHA domain-containing protein [Chloroflexi bacterium]|uniref:FHA domain-containing protein n=1 Tax=Candidatus Chlorohelix allophototropha TaxID=3003348 RepID=A0A8T7M5X1_9CHLR|nr:FHA domain-containing protein [Chloroflexota bacterium]WJW69423.1 FHA domain-containing protein [Chloroflexota bacterium L227-S17]
MSVKCQQCNHQNPDDVEFCENCGAQLPVSVPTSGIIATAVATPASAQVSDILICPNCKAPFTIGDVFCFNCGYDLTKQHAIPASSIQVAAAVSNPPTQPATAVNSNSQPDISADEFEKMLSSGAPLPAAEIAQPTPVATPVQPASGFAAVAVQEVAAPAIAVGNLILTISGPYGVEKVTYIGRELLLGRQDIKTRIFPDVALDDAASSRRHLAIWQEASDEKFYAQDLESSNGTLLNDSDMPPGEPVQLKNGDVIKIGTRYNIQITIA